MLEREECHQAVALFDRDVREVEAHDPAEGAEEVERLADRRAVMMGAPASSVGPRFERFDLGAKARDEGDERRFIEGVRRALFAVGAKQHTDRREAIEVERRLFLLGGIFTGAFAFPLGAPGASAVGHEGEREREGKREQKTCHSLLPN